MKTKAVDASQEYHGLLLRLIELSNRDSSRGIAVAITSVSRGHGVSYVTGMLSAGLEKMFVPRVIQVSLGVLERAQSASEVYSSVKDQTNGHAPSAPQGVQQNASAISSNWTHSLESRQRLISELCVNSRIVLIDCPPLRQGNGMLIAAGVVDRVILVLQAGVTTRDDVLYAERKIQGAGGNLEGYVLNKAHEILPKWFHRDK